MVKAGAEGRTNLLIFVEPPPDPCALNQRGRTRMLGGVGRVPGNGHPYPISVLFCLPCQVSCGRILGLIPNDGITFLTGYESIYGLFVEVERIES